jgi:hypothetical protein
MRQTTKDVIFRQSVGLFFNIFTNSLGAVVPVAPAFVDFKPGPYLRPFASESEECESAVGAENEFCCLVSD